MIMLTNKSFKEEVTDYKGTVLVDFFANWCGPCRALSPVIEEISKEDTSVKVCKVDVDKEPELAREFMVMSIPCLIVFKDGEVVNKSVGLISKSEVLDLIK